MSRTCLLFFVLLSGVYTYANAATPNNVAFYYGREAPIGALYAYDWVVLQQDQATDARIDLLRKGGTQPVSYISIGEIAKSHRYFREIQEHWKLGRNEAWESVVLDLRLPDVRQFILDQLIAPAMARGFSGLFMDTLDSHLLTPQGKAQPDAFADGQAALLENIRNRWPGARIIINRGFHLPEASHALVDALAFESWRAGYLAGQNQYVSVPDQDRAWLAQQLNHWRTRHPEVPLIAIDYLRDDDMAPEHAAQLRAEGFIPYVTNGALNRLGPTEPHTVKRHILVVHDQAPGGMDQSAAHRRLGIVLERLGLVPVYRSAREPHPREPLDDRYAGVVVWWETGNRSTGFCQWLAGQQSPSLPVVTFGLPPLQPACQSLMGSRRLVTPETPLTFGERHESVARYEGGQLPVSPLSPLPAMMSGNAWITATGSDGATYQPVYTFAQGGTAVAPFVLETGPEDQAFWLFDPFRFLSEALHLNPFPAADSTTESGRRILTAHIDGDGFVSRAELPGSPMSAAVILDRILTRFPIPHTVSVIEAETSPEGLYPASSNEAEALARRLFQLDHVEIASHSYSHPFFWRVLEGGSAPSQENTLYGYALDIPGYTATLAREIAGSVNYINRQLAPPGKPVSVFLWTGDARPGEKALARVRELGLVNVNGGDTHPLPYDSGLAGVWPDARPVGDELQVYAPVMNENVYTNLWTGPFYGFRNVIDSFRILEEKDRLKPVGIYYHFYSGTKPESLSALEEVYRYALSQPVIPLHLSDYARRVQAQYYSALTVTGDGGFRWQGLHVPSSVRVGLSQYPDLQRSQGVAGYRDVNGQRFVHLAGPNATLYLSQAPVTGPYIESANAIMTDWQREKQEGTWRLQAELRGYQPIEIVIAGAGQCIVQNDMPMTQTRRSGNLVLSSPGARQVSLDLECR
ncbi:MAG TPA: endo alpha-1,4 polygalactosaminidase [Marinobacter sp.]|uniref:endo alpha-1,4 polygalactosaminidase n=1 Tax=Marinobacter sp. TaxID=50741 RepID=UPI002D80D13C|nr:endo alpha-1,4 polygalactosaminidase [Marinobacter sp.]HET8802777.1 endo alpha-1,4 polygalactosaminidase [Marinobacter sp.]